ncbi:MAG: hypothetical protein LBH72_07620 [Proteiniphilum sp.]|nr:hypothetical protein [Proteiniphilum sp.]
MIIRLLYNPQSARSAVSDSGDAASDFGSAASDFGDAASDSGDAASHFGDAGIGLRSTFCAERGNMRRIIPVFAGEILTQSQTRQ